MNTKLAKVPTTFAQLEQEALAVKKAKHQTFGIAVQQGSGGDAYHMYPFFSGLGGYVFGTQQGREPRSRRTSASRTRRSSRTRT